ncbi:alpha/beta fold hydrolase [Actinomycetospora straminea]|uniref:Alpha/beta hydrolase n=1 Tax=Actinomycetospora straminea TaxID=663607 RepID=A0ABP9EZA5_9PSEU|nr:alpha/beta hydrolase [Actinomycetospora straminea]MDD7935759.1 alpha/beta hydrolase [Actinomycetospora straminea]
MPTIEANGTTLYYERRGDGPPLLFISGALGDAGYWTDVADELADTYTVITYDRRANSRSPRPEGYSEAPIGEQADDAAALLGALDLVPATVYGNSQGAIILTDLVLRHPDVVRAAVLHEPPYVAMTSDPDTLNATLQQMVGEAMERGGPPMAVEAFLRWVCGDAVYEALDPDLRARVLANGEVLFGIEMASLFDYMPDQAELARVRVPCVVAAGVDNADPTAQHHWFHEAAVWLADRLGTRLVLLPGAHVPQATHPHELATSLRPLLSELEATRPVDA